MSLFKEKVDRSIKLFDLIEIAIQENKTYELFVLVDERGKVIDELMSEGFSQDSEGFQTVLEQTGLISERIGQLIKVYEEAVAKEVASANAVRAYSVSQFFASNIGE